MAAPVPGTILDAEALEAPAAVERMLAANRAVFSRIASHLRAAPPAVVVTCARGSSDHAATFGKYLFETYTGTPTASAAPSVASIYAAPARAPGKRVCIAISQSGRSPDLVAAVERERAAGALVVALVNTDASPLAELADEVVALSAGPEHSIAATKSYLCSLAALAALTAEWSGDSLLGEALNTLPEQLAIAAGLDWSLLTSKLREARSLFVLGRGYGLGAAQEMALKLKETCAIHAEAFSAAEVRHGPMAIVGAGFPVLALGGSDAAAASVHEVAREFRARGASVLVADPDPGSGDLPMLAGHPALEPILAIQSFYRALGPLAAARGRDADAPPHLRKVTKTL